MKYIDLRITDEMLDQAKIASKKGNVCTQCIISQAMNDKGFKNTFTGPDTIRFNANVEEYAFELNVSVTKYINQFDRWCDGEADKPRIGVVRLVVPDYMDIKVPN